MTLCVSSFLRAEALQVNRGVGVSGASSSRSVPPVETSECATEEACLAEAEEMKDTARAMLKEAADLRTAARVEQDVLSQAMAARAENNILPFKEAADEVKAAVVGVWRTTLQLIEEEAAGRGTTRMQKWNENKRGK